MANPKLPGISEAEQTLLYSKLKEYNRGRASFKEVGVYLVVLPRPANLNYSLWFYSPELEKQSILYIHDLSPDINEALRMASTMLYYSRRCLAVVEYNEKRMRSNGEDIVFFGKYRGHFLHEILEIDPAYLSWIAYKFTPKIPKQERFVKIAQAYHSVHLDFMLRKSRHIRQPDRYLGTLGEKLVNLKLKVLRVRLEDDPYKTRIKENAAQFYVKQVLTLVDPTGNRVIFSLAARYPSTASGCLAAMEHAYEPGEIVYVASARVSRIYESGGIKYTRLSHVKLTSFNASSSHP